MSYYSAAGRREQGSPQPPYGTSMPQSGRRPQHQKQKCALQNVIIRFTPNSDRESGFSQKVMSALPPKADMCGALAHVRFGAEADPWTAASAPLFDHLVGARKQLRWDFKAKYLCGF